MNAIPNNLGQFVELPNDRIMSAVRGSIMCGAIIASVDRRRVEHERMLLINAGLPDDEVERVAAYEMGVDRG